MELVQTEVLSSDVGHYRAPSACVPELIAAQAARHPDALALTAGDQRLNYGELDRQANVLARHLRSLGAGADALVGLYLPRSLEMVVGALAVLRAGAAYVPMDPAYPADRLSFMLDDAQASILLSTTALADRLGPAKAKLVYLDIPEWDRGSTAAPPVKIKPDNLAYVIYTSGSTGRPKGVEITHGRLGHLVPGTIRHFRDRCRPGQPRGWPRFRRCGLGVVAVSHCRRERASGRRGHSQFG